MLCPGSIFVLLSTRRYDKIILREWEVAVLIEALDGGCCVSTRFPKAKIRKHKNAEIPGVDMLTSKTS